MKDKYKSLSKNVILFTICKFGQKFLSFFLVPLYTNFLSTEEYGIIDLIVNIASLLVPVVTLSISSSVMRFTMQSPKDNRYLAHGLKIGGFGIVVLCLLWGMFYLFPVSSFLERKYYVWIVALGICYICNNIYTDYLRGINKIKLMVWASIANTFVNLTLNILFIVVLRFGVSGYLLGNCAGMICAVVIIEIREKMIKKIDNGRGLTKDEKREVYKYSIPLIFSSLAWWVNSSLDRIFVIYFKGISENGIYSVAYKIPNILAAFDQVFSQAWLLSSVKEYNKEDSDGYFTKMYKTYNATMVIMCAIVIFINIPLSKLIYAKDFYEAWRCVPVLLLATMFLCLKTFMNGIFTAVKDSKFSAYTYIGSAVINSILNAILIPIIGILGAAIATCFCYYTIYFVSLVFSRKYIKMSLNYAKEEGAHILLLIQVIAATTASHLYIFQVLIIAVLFLIFYKRYLKLFGSIMKQIKLKVNKIK